MWERLCLNADRKLKHSHCEAKFGSRVWETKFGRVRRKSRIVAGDVDFLGIFSVVV